MEDAHKVEELLAQRDKLMLNNAEWAVLSRALFDDGRGVSYQSIRRMELGSVNPRRSTLRRLEETLEREEAARKKENAKPAHERVHHLFRLAEALSDANQNTIEALRNYARQLSEDDFEEVRQRVLTRELHSPSNYALAALAGIARNKGREK